MREDLRGEAKRLMESHRKKGVGVGVVVVASQQSDDKNNVADWRCDLFATRCGD